MQLDDYTKSVLSDEKLLRSKLLIYFKKPEAIEYYAKTILLAFNAGKQENFDKVSDWSWWGFFYGWIFLWYRGSNVTGIFFGLGLASMFLYFSASATQSFALTFVLICFNLVILFHLSKYSKFYIVEKFIDNLKLSNGDDALLATYGNTNTFAFMLGLILSPFVILETIGYLLLPIIFIGGILEAILG